MLHDEPWNLTPTLHDVNSSKGDRLPSLKLHLAPLCAQQLDAVLTLRDRSRHRKVMESYLAIDGDVLEYERSERSLDAFTRSLSRVIVPLHQTATNQGFPPWFPAVA